MKIGDTIKTVKGDMEITALKQTGKTIQINNSSMFVIADNLLVKDDYTPAIYDRVNSLEVKTNLSGKELEKVLKKLDKFLGGL